MLDRFERALPMCQCCGVRIETGELVVRVQSGVLEQTGHPHNRVASRIADDFFHARCDVAIPTPVVPS